MLTKREREIIKAIIASIDKKRTVKIKLAKGSIYAR